MLRFEQNGWFGDARIHKSFLTGKIMPSCSLSSLFLIYPTTPSLGTLFGCVGGFIIGTLLVTEGVGSLTLIGNPLSPPVSYKIIGVVLATGTGGNLSSYIGASIDIITNEKTIFNLVNVCCQKVQGNKLVKPLKEK